MSGFSDKEREIVAAYEEQRKQIKAEYNDKRLMLAVKQQQELDALDVAMHEDMLALHPKDVVERAMRNYSEHLGRHVTTKELLNTSLGVNGWALAS